MAEKKTYMTGTDFLVKPDGSCYHLGTKKGEVHQRILTVGDPKRARRIAEACFDNGKILFEKYSDRLMLTLNGKYNGVDCSIIAIGMGSPMMDFMVREASYCQPEEIACVRLGTCGIFNEEDQPGTIFAASKGSMYSYVNYGYQAGGHMNIKDDSRENLPAYFLSKPIKGSDPLHDAVMEACKAHGITAKAGMNACGETFYACQGRKSEDFNDESQNVMPTLESAGIDFMEMETHQLFSLAKRRRKPLHAAAACIGIVSRKYKGNITAEDLLKMETNCGKACLEALTKFKL